MRFLGLSFLSLLVVVNARAALSCKKPLPNSTSYDTLKSAISKCGIKSIDQLLPLLPEEMRANFTLVYKSESPEKDAVDSLHPRVILFSNDGKLLLAFTGDPKKPHSNALQVIQFRDSSAKFEFNELVFQKNGSVIENGHGPMALNVKQHQPPESCASCHKVDSRPNWEAYRFWPGVYGSDDDDLAESSPFSPFKSEYKKYMQFVQQQKNKGRYASLNFVHKEKNAPYRSFMGSDESKTPPPQSASRRPNLRLTALIQRLNAKRIVRILKASPSYERHKYRIAAGLLNPEYYFKDKSCMPFSVGPAMLEKAIQIKSSSEKTKVSRLDSALKADLGDGSPGNSFSGSEPTDVGYLLYISDLLGVDPSIFSTSFLKDSYAIYDGTANGVGDFILGEMLRDFSAKDPDFKKYIGASYFSQVNNDLNFNERDKTLAAAIDGVGGAVKLSATQFDTLCKKLKKHITNIGTEAGDCEACTDSRISGAAPLPTNVVKLAKEVNQGVNPFQTCIACHTASELSDSIPKIPFDDLSKLDRSLRDKPNLRSEIIKRVESTDYDQMPPDGDLSSEEKKIIKEYLSEYGLTE